MIRLQLVMKVQVLYMLHRTIQYYTGYRLYVYLGCRHVR